MAKPRPLRMSEDNADDAFMAKSAIRAIVSRY